MRQLAHPTIGFGVPTGLGVPTTLAPHYFVVSIPRGQRQPVRITEDLGMHQCEILDRAIIQRPVWADIAEPVQRYFNRRLLSHDLAPSRWKAGENAVDRLLGKELCVLAWAVEDLEPEKIGTALRNWLALREEERWWLFGMTAASDGWRVALRFALGERRQAA